MNICVLGSSRSSIEISTHLAAAGRAVAVVTDAEQISRLRRGTDHSHGNEQSSAFHDAVARGSIRIRSKTSSALQNSEVAIICVDPADQSPDRDEQVLSIVKDVEQSLKKGAVVLFAFGPKTNGMQKLARLVSANQNRRFDFGMLQVHEDRRTQVVFATAARVVDCAVAVTPAMECRGDFLLQRNDASRSEHKDSASRFAMKQSTRDAPKIRLAQPSEQKRDEMTVSEVQMHLSILLDEDFSDKRITLWGWDRLCRSDRLAYEDLLTWLQNRNANVVLYGQSPELRFQSFVDRQESIRGADALVILDSSPEFAGVEPGALRWRMRALNIIDPKSVLNPEWFFACPGYISGKASAPQTTLSKTRTDQVTAKQSNTLAA